VVGLNVVGCGVVGIAVGSVVGNAVGVVDGGDVMMGSFDGVCVGLSDSGVGASVVMRWHEV
jgi:hypothetical protein